MKFLKWVATLIEDRTGNIDEKRVGFFICLFILYKAMDSPAANEIVIYTAACLAFGLVGLTVPEWFSDIKSKTTSLTTSTETKTNTN